MPDRRYDHNVDIKSTQLGNAIKKTGINLAKGIGGILGLGFIGLVLLAIIISISESNTDNKERERTISITSAPRMRGIVKDYQNNMARYDIEWDRRYVTHIGKVEKISSYEFEISTQTPRLGKVICDWKSDQKEQVAKLNAGDIVSVIGKLSVTRSRYGGEGYEFTIDSCEIT